MAGLLASLFRLPLRMARPIVQPPLSFVLLVCGVRVRRNYSLPVASLDEARAQPVLFALRRAAVTEHEQAIADRWLEALQVCQVAFSVLLGELDEVEANLRFWAAQEQRGRHFWADLLQRGPLHFVGRLARLMHLRQPPAGALSEADLVEKRVLIFRLLRSALCEALAQVQASAALLYLQQQQQQPAAAAAAGAAPASPPGGQPRIAHAASAGEIAEAGPAGPAGAAGAAGAGEEEEGLFQRADRLVAASLAGVSAALRQLDASVHATLDAQQGPAPPPAQDWQVLQGALTRVLGLTHLRRVFSRVQLQQAGGGGGDGAAEAGGAAAGPGGPSAAAAAAAGQALPAAAAGPAGAPLPAAAALAEARQAVGDTLLLPANASVHSALQSAQRSARSMRAKRIIQVPHWAAMPSELQRHWIRYTLVGVAVGWGGVFVHSRLSGSRDLDDWARSAVSAVRGTWADHVVGPLADVKNELFNTFRRRPTIVSMSDYEADRDSLSRMLEDFRRDFIQKRGAAAAALPAPGDPAAPSGTAPAVPGGDAQLLEGMDLVMRTYEREMQKPLRNLVGGELVRALLIQVQKLKVDTASAMLEMDQILKANELSISLLAAVPAFLIAGTSLYYLGRMVTPTPPDPRREALPMRMAFVEVERALEHVAAAEEAAAAAAAGGEAPAAEAVVESREQQGLMLFRLAAAYEEARELFRRHRGLLAIGGSEWPNIRSDLLELGGLASVPSKMRTAQRMVRSYSIFQQF
ncbi:hypothetical protein ABPG75_012381 [Micractinium tetrahymenae]